MINRLKIAATVIHASGFAAADPTEFAIAKPAAAPQALFIPLHYERNYAYPLIVWLHGPGDDERQVSTIMPLVSMRNYVAAGPRGPRRAESGLGYCWPDTDAGLGVARRRVFECLELARQRFNVHPRRVFLGGFQCGGAMAARLALSHPDCFAGVINIGGAFPRGGAVLRNLAAARDLPFFVAQGFENSSYTFERMRQELRAFHAADLKIHLRLYPCGDELTTEMLKDLDAWLMERVTGVGA